MLLVLGQGFLLIIPYYYFSVLCRIIVKRIFCKGKGAFSWFFNFNRIILMQVRLIFREQDIESYG